MHPTILKLMLLLVLAGLRSDVDARSALGPVVSLDSGRDCSIRGMSIPGNDVIWASGSKGQVARSTDGGRTWRWYLVTGFEKTDFRDIHAFDSLTAIVMGIGNPAYMLKTRDGGRSWQLVFSKAAPGMFLDAMDFRNAREGICIGDPVEAAGRKRFFVIRTSDGGDSWQEDPAAAMPAAQDGEAVFSASGSNIALLRGQEFRYAFISGGLVSKLYLIGRDRGRCKAYPLPLIQGSESSGAFSMATDRKRAFYCVGGDYKSPGAMTDVFAWTEDGGASWRGPGRDGPSGYRSCIGIIGGRRLVACGSNGVDLCDKAGRWQRIAADGFNICVVSPDRKRVFFGGSGGRIGMLRL